MRTEGGETERVGKGSIKRKEGGEGVKVKQEER